MGKLNWPGQHKHNARKHMQRNGDGAGKVMRCIDNFGKHPGCGGGVKRQSFHNAENHCRGAKTQQHERHAPVFFEMSGHAGLL